MVNGDLPHTKKPDLDNLVKNPMDCMNGIVYEDDRLVTKIFAEKCYGLEPRTEIRVIWCESDKETDSENGPQYGPKNTHNHLVE